MNLLPTLFDVLLSLTFVFFIASLFVSGIWEFISTILRDKRATLLHNSLRHLLSDPAFAELIYGHPLIQGLVIRRRQLPLERLFRRFLSREVDPLTHQVLLRPAYIEPEVFARALLGLIQQYAAVAGPATPASVPLSPLQNNLTQLTQLISGLPASSLPITPDARRELQVVLTALLQDADASSGGVKKALAAIETWYNAYMDRVSGYFKQYSQRGIRWVALALVIFFNLDALHLTTRLYRDPALRALTIGQATAVVRAVGDSLIDIDARRTVGELAIREQFRRDSTRRTSLTADTLSRLAHRRDSLLRLLARKNQSRADSLEQRRTVWTAEALGLQQLPVGWGTFMTDLHDPANGHPVWFLTKMVAGWALMVAALAFGAPFWFDVLVKLVNIRNVGKRPTSEPKS